MANFSLKERFYFKEAVGRCKQFCVCPSFNVMDPKLKNPKCSDPITAALYQAPSGRTFSSDQLKQLWNVPVPAMLSLG